MKTKFCKKCQTEKFSSDFSKASDRKDGLYYCCKDCRSKSRATPAAKKHRRDYYLKNRRRIIDREKARYKENKEKILEYHREYYYRNKEVIQKKVQQYNKSARGRKLKSENNKRRYRTDLNYKLGTNLRKRLNRAIKNCQKTGSAVVDLGCSIEEFKEYIESKFQEGMSWDSYGKFGWHLDHIKPLSSFNLEDRVEFLQAAHYNNYQPLWWRDNLKKNRY